MTLALDDKVTVSSTTVELQGVSIQFASLQDISLNSFDFKLK